jgi:hypothetical protein
VRQNSNAGLYTSLCMPPGPPCEVPSPCWNRPSRRTMQRLPPSSWMFLFTRDALHAPRRIPGFAHPPRLFRSASSAAKCLSSVAVSPAGRREWLVYPSHPRPAHPRTESRPPCCDLPSFLCIRDRTARNEGEVRGACGAGWHLRVSVLRRRRSGRGARSEARRTGPPDGLGARLAPPRGGECAARLRRCSVTGRDGQALTGRCVRGPPHRTH